MQRCLLVITAVSMMTLMTHAQEEKTDNSKETEASSDANSVGYFLGVSMGQQLFNQGLRPGDFDPKQLAEGVSDALAKKDFKLSDEELQASAKQLQSMLNDRMEKLLTEQKEKGKQWLVDNLKEDGVKELVGGMQYKVITAGDGASPGPSDKVKVHYTGTLTDGKLFDSSVKRGQPAEFVVGGVIKGWQMALQKMKVGDKWMLYIPSELAYGERGSPPVIGPNEVLVFEVELLDIL